MTACLSVTSGHCLPGTQTAFQLRLFRTGSQPEKPDSDTAASARDDTIEAAMEAIVCRQCLHEITSAAESQEVLGAHIHTFANPEGVVFEIGCYGSAWGCGYIGAASAEFTWFAGYVWRIAVCVQCHTHLGWHFSGPEGHFFHGLITSRIRSAHG